jgi:hypothetical protein
VGNVAVSGIAFSKSRRDHLSIIHFLPITETKRLVSSAVLELDTLISPNESDVAGACQRASFVPLWLDVDVSAQRDNPIADGSRTYPFNSMQKRPSNQTALLHFSHDAIRIKASKRVG